MISTHCGKWTPNFLRRIALLCWREHLSISSFIITIPPNLDHRASSLGPIWILLIDVENSKSFIFKQQVTDSKKILVLYILCMFKATLTDSCPIPAVTFTILPESYSFVEMSLIFDIWHVSRKWYILSLTLLLLPWYIRKHHKKVYRQVSGLWIFFTILTFNTRVFIIYVRPNL